MNPGPYVSDRPAGPKEKPLAPKQFRRQVGESVRWTATLAREFATKKGADDAPWLLNFLVKRSKTVGRDQLAELACERLAALHDPALLTQAMPLARRHGQRALMRGLGTPKCRDFLLAKVTDEKEPMERRLAYANILAKAGELDFINFTEIMSSWRPVSEEDEGTSGYLARIARAAHDCRRHEELCLALVACIDRFGIWIVQVGGPQTRADLRGALAELRRLYEATGSGPVRFAVEVATAHADRKAYDRLKSPCGLLPSIVRPADAEKYAKPVERSLIFAYSYDTTLLAEGAELRPVVVLVHQASRQRHALPSGVTLQRGSNGGGPGAVILPKDLPRGRYRVFFEITKGEKVVSTSHSCEVDLPQPGGDVDGAGWAQGRGGVTIGLLAASLAGYWALLWSVARVRRVRSSGLASTAATRFKASSH
jgi:hypothetical protein